jgi:V/A-type H+-transporting ATPase subunit C
MRLVPGTDFAYGNTRLRARRGELLRGADYERLIGADVHGLLAALRSTAYAPDVEAAQRSDGLRQLPAAIRSNVGRSLEEMRSFYSDCARELVDLLLSRFDVQNIVSVLRAKAGGQKPAEAAPIVLASVGWLVEPLAGELLRQRELAGAVDLLARSTPDRDQAHALRAAFSEYERTEDLAALERAVVADQAARGAATLGAARRDGSTLLRLMPREIDERNLLVALRLRDAVGGGAAAPPSPEDALLPGGSAPPAAFEAAVQVPAPNAVAGALGPVGREAWRAPLARWAATGDLTALERELERGRIADATALFAAGDPLAIDVPLAFMAAKLAEARNLRLLGEAGVRRIAPDVVRRELLWPGVRA